MQTVCGVVLPPRLGIPVHCRRALMRRNMSPQRAASELIAEVEVEKHAARFARVTDVCIDGAEHGIVCPRQLVAVQQRAVNEVAYLA